MPRVTLTIEKRNSGSLSIRIAGSAEATRVPNDLAQCVLVVAATR